MEYVLDFARKNVSKVESRLSSEANAFAAAASRTAPLVEANGARIPAIGFGTWQLRGEAYALSYRIDRHF